MKQPSKLLTVTALILASFNAGCSGKASNRQSSGPIVLKGAGATAPLLAYTKWIEAYEKEAKTVRIEYQGTGSGEGIRQLEAGLVDFAASDMPLPDTEMAKLKAKPLHFPTLVGAIVAVYNLPGIIELKFSGETLAGIFSGRITRWNDPALTKLNPGVALPSSRITVFHRSDSSGSTYALTDFLSKASARWKKEIGTGPTAAWPVGETQAGNEEMARAVKSTPASIGYVELNYAIGQQLTYGAVQNAAGKFKKPDLEAVGSAIDQAQAATKDFRVSITNPPSPNAYPIATLTYLIVPGKYDDPAKQREMKAFLRWAYSAGQRIAMKFDYGILQPPLLDHVRDQIADIR